MAERIPFHRLAWGLLASGLLAAPALAAEGNLEIFPDLPRLLGLILLFAVLILPADRLLLRPLLAVLEERERRIAGARQRATELAREADQVLRRYEAAVHEARQAADQERTGRLAEARQEQGRITVEARSAAEAELQSARSEVGEALASAREQVRQQIDELASQVAAQVLGRELT